MRNLARAIAQEQQSEAPPNGRGLRASATFAPASYNAEKHTVDLVLSTGSDVKRFGFIERLLIDPKAVDLSRVAKGAVKVNDSHNVFDTGKLIGSLLSAKIEAGRLLGTMHFAEVPFAVEKEGMVARGELTSVSIGYDVEVWRSMGVITDSTTGVETPIWRAESWSLVHVAFVLDPADPDAGVRSAPVMASHSGMAQPAESGGSGGEQDMFTRENPGAPTPANSPNPAVMRFTADEAISLIDTARDLGVDTRARELIASNGRGEVSTQVARDEILAAAAQRQRGAISGIAAGTAGRVTVDSVDVARAGMQDAIVSRMTGRNPETEAGRNFRSMDILGCGRYLANLRGERGVEFLPKMELAKRMMTTSDFPQLLGGAGNRVLVEIFSAAPNPLKDLARRTTIDDFRAKNSIKLDNVSELDFVGEAGEYHYGSALESYESYRLGKWGKIFRFSLEAMVNDDLGAFTDFTRRMGQLAAWKESQILVQLLTLNSGVGPVLSDTTALFATEHGNIAAAGSAISIESLKAARLAMRTQKAPGREMLSPAVPKTLLVGPQKETEGEAVLATLNAAKIDDVNPFSGKLALAVEPRLTGNGWYVFGDSALTPVIEYAYLTGYEGPQFETRNGFEVDGVDMKVSLFFGCGAIDYRGAYRNAGN